MQGLLLLSNHKLGIRIEHPNSGIRFPSGRAFCIAFLWQLLPAAWLMWDAWDSPSAQTVVLRAVVFLLVPIVSGLVHRSWEIGLAALLLPVFAIGAMFTVFMLLMPVGKW
jgi:hypothetical protein